MIEVLVLSELAASRRLALFRVPLVATAPGGSMVLLDAVILWPVAPTPENKLTRDDAWLVLAHESPDIWSTRLVFAADAELLDASTDVVIPAIHVDMPVSAANARHLAESIALACRDGLRVSFRYHKVGGGPVEQRAGRALGTKGVLLFLEDADRLDGAGKAQTRSFRIDGIAAFHPTEAERIPRWDGAGYSVPAVIVPVLTEGA